MKKTIVLLCAAIILAGLCTACGKAPEAGGPLGGAYWKAVEFEGEDASGEFWSDLFLWDDGSGYFRFSQESSADSGFWGMRDVADCGWIQKDGTLTLTKSDSPGTVFCTGNLNQDRLTLTYEGVLNLTIIMEQAEMPPYGTQWEIPDLYGTWQMVSYADTKGRSHALDEPGRYFASEITFHPVGGTDYWLVERIFDNNYHYTEMEYNLGIAQYMDGSIWDGCKNEAWYIELGDTNDPAQRFYATYADGRLLLKKDNANNPGSPFHLSFTAEYRFLRDYGYEFNPDPTEWEGDWAAEGEKETYISIANLNPRSSSFDFSFVGYYEDEDGRLDTGNLAGTAYFTEENRAVFDYTGGGGEEIHVGFVLHDGLLLVSMSDYYEEYFGLGVEMDGVYSKTGGPASGIEQYEKDDKDNNYMAIIEFYQKFVDAGGTEGAADSLLNNLALELGYRYEEQLYGLGASIAELRYSYGDMGYAIRDVNGDGIPDLFILAGEPPEIAAIYTLRDGNPVLVGAYWSRNRISLVKNGMLYNSGSSGAANSSDTVYSINTWQDGELLVLIEMLGVEDYDDEEMIELPEPRYYRIKDGEKTILSEEEADAAWRNFDNAYLGGVYNSDLSIVPIM
ncbi:MAG: hypothetical protein FWG42_03695 [Clostridiales bacterium]|nr:hypothetical protein [Clostridiales bacterium]